MTENRGEEMVRLMADAVENGGTDALVDQLTRYACQCLKAHSTGVTLLKAHHRFETVGATQPVVMEIDRLQYTFKEGVCVDAALDERLVHSDDVASDARWPRWGPATADLGIRSMMSYGLHAGGHRVGALNVYGEKPGQFDHADRELLHSFGGPAAATIAVARKIEGLTNALDSRSLIGQAQGVLMVTYSVDAQVAFAILARYSQQHNIKLREVAQLVVDTGGLPIIFGDTATS